MHIKPIFTIDWEPYFCYRPYSQFWEENDPLVEEPTMYLLDLLRRHQIKAIWYCLGWLVDKQQSLFKKINEEGHIIGDHTYFHDMKDYFAWYRKRSKDEFLKDPLFRSPRFEGQKRLYSGGFWFRVLPYRMSKKLLEQSGVFYIHPHDVLFRSPVEMWKRTIGLKTVRDKLERLTREVEFEAPILQPA